MHLMPTTTILRKVIFPDGVHKDIHHALYSMAKAAFAAIFNGDRACEGEGTDFPASYRYMIALTTRIRQACYSSSLLATDQRKQILRLTEELQSNDLSTLSPNKGRELLFKLHAWGGQERPVRVYRFVTENSIEERLVKFQLSKATLGIGTMEALSAKEEKSVKLSRMQVGVCDRLQKIPEIGRIE